MAQEFKSCAECAGILSIVKKCTYFCFGCRRHNITHDSADNVDGSIEWWCWGIGIIWIAGISEVEMASSARACF